MADKKPVAEAVLALDPAEVAAHGDPEFVEAPAGDDNDPNDVSGVGEEEPAEKPAAVEKPKPAAEAEPEPEPADDDEPKTEAELKEALAQSKRAVKALTGRLSSTAAEKRRLNEQLAATIKPVAAAADGEAAPATPERADFATKAEFDVAVRAEAARQKAVDAFNDRCNDIEDKGAKAFGKKWGDAKAQLGILDDQGRIPFDLLNCAMETDNPSQVLFALGQDLDKATEMLAMTPLKRAIAMSKLAETKPAERQRSKAPPPVEPIGGRGGGDDKPSDSDSDEEWNRKEAIREANVRKARGY